LCELDSKKTESLFWAIFVRKNLIAPFLRIKASFQKMKKEKFETIVREK